MNYIWSKKSLLDFIYKNIISVVWDRDFMLSDLFAGTGIVGSYFKEKWHPILANDMQYFSYVLNRNYIWNHTDLYFSWLSEEIPDLLVWDVNSYKSIVCNYLDNLPTKEWFIYKNYSLWWTLWWEFERQYFSDYNALKCDTIRLQIWEWRDRDVINEDEYYFLLASLIESIDKVANTASVYGAFLKKLKKSAQRDFKLEPAEFFVDYIESKVYNEDINELIKHTTHDVVYLDPPYNHRQYSDNYHILETIAKYDNPKIKWKTGLRDTSSQKSGFSRKREVLESFEYLIENIDANYIFLSYNDEWLLTLDEIRNIMSKRWEYGVFTKWYRRFKADKTSARNHKKDSVIEYLHYVAIK